MEEINEINQTAIEEMRPIFEKAQNELSQVQNNIPTVQPPKESTMKGIVIGIGIAGAAIAVVEGTKKVVKSVGRKFGKRKPERDRDDEFEEARSKKAWRRKKRVERPTSEEEEWENENDWDEDYYD